MSEHYDALETRDPNCASASSSSNCARQIAYAKAHAPDFARTLADVDPASITSRDALARLPVVRKSELAELQTRSASVRRIRGSAMGRGEARLRVARRRSTSPKALRPTTGVSRAHSSPPAFAPATSFTTASRTIARRRARCSRPARTRSAARCFPAAPGRPSSKWRRWPICSRPATSARRRSCASSSRAPTSSA